jgi:hypothetical protein
MAKYTQQQIIQALENSCKIHLGAWGGMAMEYLKENYPLAYQLRIMNGTLLEEMKCREDAAKNFMFDTRQLLFKQNPFKADWPYLQKLQHRKMIEDQAWEMTQPILFPQSDHDYVQSVLKDEI